MNVRELKAKLEGMPEDAEVFMLDESSSLVAFSTSVDDVRTRYHYQKTEVVLVPKR